MRLYLKAFAMACGIVWGGFLFLAAWWVWLFEGPAESNLAPFSKIYRGYRPGPVGSLIGLVWGIIDGVIGGVIFGWLYNAFSKKEKQTIQVEL